MQFNLTVYKREKKRTDDVLDVAVLKYIVIEMYCT